MIKANIEQINTVIEAVDKLFKRMALPIALLVGAHFLEVTRNIGDVSLFYGFLIGFSAVYIFLISVSCFQEMISKDVLISNFNKGVAIVVLGLLVLSIYYSLWLINFGNGHT